MRIYSLFGSPRLFFRGFSNTVFNKVVIPQKYPNEVTEIVDSIKVIVNKRIKPVVQQDGGDVEFVAYYHDTGEVFIRLCGACVGCSQSDITLKHMIQGMLTYYVPEVTKVYNCDQENNILGIDE